MKKQEILDHLRDAKIAHIKWVDRAKLLINGADIEEDSIPVESADCKFGKWLYEELNYLKKLPNAPIELLDEIEELHRQVHSIYMKIFSIYFSKDKKLGFFAKLLSGKSRKDPTEQEKADARNHLKELEEVSKKLLKKLDQLETMIQSTPIEEF